MNVHPFLTSVDRCHDWLLNNLMTHQNVDLMKELGYVCTQQREQTMSQSLYSTHH